MRNLTGKQRAFIEHYTGDSFFNATEAASRAGYKGNRNQLDSVASENLQKLAIKVAISEKLAEIAEKIEITVESIAEEISVIAFGRISPTIGVQGNITNKLKALELLGRFKAMFTDNINQTDTQRQRELDEKQTHEAEAIASIRLREFKQELLVAKETLKEKFKVG